MDLTSNDNLKSITKTIAEINFSTSGFLNEDTTLFDWRIWELIFHNSGYDNRYKIFDLLHSYIEVSMKKGLGIYIYGPPGTGKTTLLNIISTMISTKRTKGIVLNSKYLVNKFNIRGDKQKDHESDRFSIVNKGLRTAWYIRNLKYRLNNFIDELGNEPPANFWGHAYPVISTIIENCYQMHEGYGDRFFASSNMSVEALPYDAHIKDRIRKMVVSIKVEGESSR